MKKYLLKKDPQVTQINAFLETLNRGRPKSYEYRKSSDPLQELPIGTPALVTKSKASSSTKS